MRKEMSGKIHKWLCGLEERTILRAAIFAGILALAAGVMLLLNLHTPLMMDDYDYSFSWATGERLSGFADVLASQAAHYRLWGGRSVTHTLAQTFLFLGKPAFNLANTAMYLLLLLELYALAKPEGRRFCWGMLLTVHGALFALVPFFGTVFLWLTGSCNYLFGTVLALLPLLLARNMERGGFFGRGALGAAAAVILCFLAGWTNENTAPAVFAMLLVRMLARLRQGEKPKAVQIAALAAQAAGVAVMLLAPGNFSRASSYAGGNIIFELAKRLATVSVYGLMYGGALLTVGIMLHAAALAMGAKPRTALAAWFALGGVLCALALVASPVASDRSYTGTVALLLAGVMTLVGDIERDTKALNAAKLYCLPLCLLLAGFSGYHALSDVRAHEARWTAQIRLAQAAAEAGEDEVTLRGAQAVSRFTMPIPLGEAPEDWPNSTLGRALGVRVRGTL